MASDLWETHWGNENLRDYWKRPSEQVLDFIASQSSQERPEVLDFGCGLGRHAVAFAKAGFHVTAIDASKTAVLYLNKWAKELDVSIRTETCDVLADVFSPSLFDIVLSYNVIYHGLRETFVKAVEHVQRLLKPAGLFFFTCPSRQDGKYGHGEEVAPHTFRCTKSITPGEIHYFADEADLIELLAGFKTLSRKKNEHYWDNNGIRQFGSNWHVLAEKR